MDKFNILSIGELGSVRTVEKDYQILFLAEDVCKCLQISNVANALKRLDEDEKELLVLSPGLKIEGNMNKDTADFVNEAGLYTLIFSSKKPNAKAFKRWITHDALPSIRTKGVYIFGEENMKASDKSKVSGVAES